MKICNCIAAVLATVLAVSSCGHKASINVELQGVSHSSVIVKLLDINTYTVLDTVKTGSDGVFKYDVKVIKGQPEFVYLFYGDTKIASLLLEEGDKVSVVADTLGNYQVEGSAESVRLQTVENDFTSFLSRFAALAGKTERAGLSDSEKKQIQKDLSSEYVNYYRKAMKYVLENSHSLTVVPVLFQKVNAEFPIFSQSTDAILFSNICDSLRNVYPDSKYVAALAKEAESRGNNLSLEYRLQNAEQRGYPDLSLPDEKGERVALSSLRGKVVLVHFWSASNASQSIFNIERILPLYEKYNSRGFDVYSVCVDTDKAQWASVVKNQKLPWTNVCDGLGTLSPALNLYAVTQIPTSVLIVDGEIYDKEVKTDAEFRRLLDKKLK